jgi:hypothetical protein
MRDMEEGGINSIPIYNIGITDRAELLDRAS